MNIPITFSFDDNFTLPAGVCITSLLDSANEDTFYLIYILYSSNRLNNENIKKVKSLENVYANCKFQFIDVCDEFQESYNNRNISIDTYYRLLIPELMPDVDRMIYSDVDIIFKGDLSSFYTSDIDNKSLGAVVTLQKERHIKGYTTCPPRSYFNAGFLLMNLRKIRQIATYKEDMLTLSRKSFEFHDQDILNILFQNDVSFFSLKYNFSRGFSALPLSQDLVQDCKDPVVIHYTGRKPWNGFVSIKSEEWWGYFCRSIFYTDEIYKNYLTGYTSLEEVWMVNKIAKKIGLISLYKLVRKILKSRAS